MKPNDSRQSIYEFGEFRLNVGQLMLYHNDAEVPLRPKAIETLVVLVERHGEIVTKDELMRTIWSGVIVEESNLSRYIHMLRSVLGKQPNGEPYIETYRRRGFRFNSEVSTPSTSVTPIGVARHYPHSPVGSRDAREGTTGNVIQLADRRRDGAATETVATARGVSDNPHNLPTPLTELIGRRVEVMELKTLLQKETVRLVTLTGTGGTGKTRLSIQVAYELLGAFADGVFFVPLASVREPALIPSTIAKTLNVEESGKAPLEHLIVFLRGKYMLLVLDNFEQLVEASPLVVELLEACPHIKVLATSRAALHIRGEHEYPVPPLPLPDSKDVLLTEALESAAVQLFVERAKQANFRFEVREDKAPAIVEICRRLDGLPLAIELAALRSRTLSPEEILDRLANRLQLLSGGARDLPARQRTMRDAIAWSYELLAAGEKSLFRQLAIFEGDFTVEAAEQVVPGKEENPRRRRKKRISSAGGPVTPDPSIVEIDVLDGITSLTDKGLLVLNDEPDGNPRFRMLEVVRELALESLEATGEASPVRRRHAEYYTALGENAETHLQTSKAGDWLNALEQDHANLRSAMRWLLENDPVRAAHLAAAIRVYLIVHSHLAEGHEWLETALERNNKLPPAVRLNLMNSLGQIRLLRGDYEAARSAFEISLSESKISGEDAHIAHSLRGLGSTANSQLNYAVAQEFCEEALAIDRNSGSKLGVASSLLVLGVIMCNQGHVEKAQTLSEESLKIHRKIGYKSGICNCLINLGEFALLTKDRESAQTFFAEALAIAGHEHFRHRLGACLDGYAALATEKKKWKRAAQLLGAAEKLRETIGYHLEPDSDDFRNIYLERSRSVLGNESFCSAYEEGREMKIYDAIALASGTYKLEKTR